ncbi:tudor and KH domain-containing protein homolog isoform X1 [Microplitis demolitor]|uniref:tudor and KH domain-containing protein homolog isoform X1 n=1 Tax=Microplitis demolitor TaxID=69319 RepID=UPI0004CD4C2D|nr:tudor and KH domain-containing protein homolog isoform X1 [Microplitis demolitor]
MSWSTRHVSIPIMIGLSLTGVLVGLYYYLCKKLLIFQDDDSKEPITVREKKNLTIEVKVPRALVPAVIGRGGSTIKDIEQRTSTRIRFSEDNVDNPERICFIKGAFECIKLAEALIVDIVANQPVIETYEMFVPQRIRSILLADRGEVINTIQSTSNAKLIIEKGNICDEKKRVIIKGTAEQIGCAVYHIEELVKESKDTQEKLEVSQSSRSPRGRVSPRPATKADNSAQTTESPSSQEGVMEVYVSASESPSQFWIQVVGPSILALDELIVEMTDYYSKKENQELHALKNISVGQTVAAKFSFDDRYYRAEVLSSTDDGYNVHFLDYGDHEIIEAKDIYELRTDFLSLRLQAVECCLANIKPVSGEDWSDEACDRFGDLSWVAQWKVIIAKVRGYKERIISQGTCRREGSPIPCVDLYDKNDNQDIDIGKQLVMENLAAIDDGAWSTASSTASLLKRSRDSQSPLNRTPPATPTSNNSQASSQVNLTPQIQIVEEIIDLTTPRKPAVEEIDLVTPQNNRKKKYNRYGKKNKWSDVGGSKPENGSGDYRRDNKLPADNQPGPRCIPGGEESYDEYSDEFEIFD